MNLDNRQKDKLLDMRIEINNKLMKKITDTSAMFWNTNYISLDLSNFDTSNITDMSCIFEAMINLKRITGLDAWNTSKAKYMRKMFYKCTSLVSLPNISKWNTDKVENMNDMFYKCDKLSNIPKWYRGK